jgi:hypothetical protein
MAIDWFVVINIKPTPQSLPRRNIMKSVAIFLGTIAIASSAALLSTIDRSASAGCIVSDINMQVTMNGSRKPTDRTNNVNQNVDPQCQGNSVHTSNVQVDRGGTERATQNRDANVTVGGGKGNRSGVNGPNIVTKTNVQIDIDNPVDRWKADHKRSN